MVSNEIRNNAAALGVLMHQVTEEQAAMLRLIKTNLVAAADHAEELEHGLRAPVQEVEPRAERSVDEVKRQSIKRGLLTFLAAHLPPDCPGECDGCVHAKEAANGQN